MNDLNLSVSLRPRSFDEVLGHTTIVQALKQQFASGRTPRAILFAGPPGAGKTTLARIVATFAQGDSLLAGETPDITELNAADSNGVDDIRELVQNTAYRPLVGLYKIVVLDEAQKLTEAAQNVLLKPMESKDSQTIWLICTTDPQKLLKPLRDRCMAFTLRGLGETDRVALVKRALAAAESKLDGKVIYQAIEKAELTSPREILMAVERYVAGMPPEEAVNNLEQAPEYFDIAKAVGSGNWTAVQEMLGKLKSADARGLRAVIAAYFKSALLKNPAGARADVIAECVLSFALYNTFEDGIAFSTTVAGLYRVCKKIKEAASH